VKMFVAKKDTNKNTVYVVPGSYVPIPPRFGGNLTKGTRNHEALFVTDLHIRDFSWIWADAPPAELSHSGGFRAHVKFRHRMESVPCTVHRYV
jgi:tRNA-specific 2-thiouridylase